jgi:hypothetical protein
VPMGMQNEIIQIEDSSSEDECNTTTPKEPPTSTAALCTEVAGVGNVNSQLLVVRKKPPVPMGMQNEVIQIEDSSSEDECNTTTPNEPPTNTAALCTEVAGVGNVNSQLLVVRQEPPAPAVEFSYAALANAGPVPQTTLMIDVSDIDVVGIYRKLYC